PRNLRIQFRGVKPEKMAFAGRLERELFYESTWFAKLGLPDDVIRRGLPVLREPIKVCLVTWNLGDAPPQYDIPLSRLLKPGNDIYCIGTQECHYSARSGYSSCEDDFAGWVGDSLGDDYLKLASTSLMSIR